MPRLGTGRGRVGRRRPRRLLASILLVAGALAGTACSSATPLAPAARAVEPGVDQAHWQPARASSIPGTWRSEIIEGAAAPSLLEITYHFEADHSYAAAALVASHPPTFQVRNGHWSLANGKLSLGDGSEPPVAEEAESRLRLSTGEGRVVLHRDEIH